MHTDFAEFRTPAAAMKPKSSDAYSVLFSCSCSYIDAEFKTGNADGAKANGTMLSYVCGKKKINKSILRHLIVGVLCSVVLICTVS